jgi:hypothetical protein
LKSRTGREPNQANLFLSSLLRSGAKGALTYNHGNLALWSGMSATPIELTFPPEILLAGQIVPDLSGDLADKKDR